MLGKHCWPCWWKISGIKHIKSFPNNFLASRFTPHLLWECSSIGTIRRVTLQKILQPPASFQSRTWGKRFHYEFCAIRKNRSEAKLCESHIYEYVHLVSLSKIIVSRFVFMKDLIIPVLYGILVLKVDFILCSRPSKASMDESINMGWSSWEAKFTLEKNLGLQKPEKPRTSKNNTQQLL